MIDNAVHRNEQVAIFYKVPAPKYVKIGNTEVVFQCEHGISLAFVSEQDVQPLLGYLGGCCGKKQQIFFLATQVQYEHWIDGNGGRK